MRTKTPKRRPSKANIIMRMTAIEIETIARKLAKLNTKLNNLRVALLKEANLRN